MDYTDFIFYGSILILSGIFFYCCWLMLCAFRKKNVPIAYAGTDHKKQPFSTKVNAKAIEVLIDDIKTKTSSNVCLSPYIVEGNSMQYADIHTGDIVLTEEPDFNKTSLPKVVVLKDKNVESYESFKLRRAWKLISDDLTISDFRNIINEIIESDKFKEVKVLVKDKCPVDKELLDEIITKYSALEKASGKSILISTTYRTTEDKIGFSIHSLDSVVGIVSYIAAKKRA